MKNLCGFLSLFALVIGCTALPAHAQEDGGNGHISLGVGWYDINDDADAADFRLEYRPNHTYFWHVKPWLGLEVTSDSSVWGGGGFLIDYEFSPNWYVIPSFGVGAYGKGDSDKDLGHVIEFRSQLEVAHEYDNGHRAGVAFGHLSNASLDDENPGTEVLNLYWHIPY